MREAEGRKITAKGVGAVILISILICALWAGLAMSGNLRFDSDRMLYSPETALKQYRSEHRPVLAALLELCQGGSWNPALNGALFILFFVLSAWILCFWLVRFTERQWKPLWYGLFVLLYGTSPVWAFQAYFTLQSGAVGFGMALAAVMAGLDVQMHTGKKKGLLPQIGWEILALAFTSVLMFIYQSLILYYAAAAVTLLLCRILRGTECRTSRMLLWIGRMVLALLAYVLLSQGQSAYLSGQILWGKESLSTCLTNICIEYGKILFAHHSGHFSLYLPGLILLAVLLVRRAKAGKQPVWLWLAAAALVLLPLGMSVLQGSRPVPRTQFALQIAAAFMVVCYAGEQEGRHRFLSVLCCVVVVLQGALVLRLAHTDDRRNELDIQAAETILQEIKDEDAEGLPLLFMGSLGYHENTLLEEKTDVIGCSFFEWGYDGNKGSSTPGAMRLLSAVTGEPQKAVNWKKAPQEALEEAKQMPCYPEKGFVRKMDGYVLIRLSKDRQ